MAITEFVGKLSALVAFEDNTVRQVLASKDENDNIAVNYSEQHDDTILHVEQDTSAITNLGTAASITVSPVASSVETSKNVTDLVFEVSGRLTEDDNTWTDFVFQYRDVGGTSEWFVPIRENTAASGDDVEAVVESMLSKWAELNADATQKAKLVDLFAEAGITLS